MEETGNVSAGESAPSIIRVLGSPKGSASFLVYYFFFIENLRNGDKKMYTVLYMLL